MSISLRICLWSMLMLLYSSYVRGHSYKKTSKGVIVKIQSPYKNCPQLVRLEVMADDIIRVSATPDDHFPNDESLMVVAQSVDATWEVQEKNDTLLALSTKALTAEVSLKTGIVIFKDKSGKTLLSETPRGTSFTSANTEDNSNCLAIRQAFQSSEDEAFYGLGQQQTGLMNYRGHHVDLTQYNSVVAAPFLVSSKNYGILWDNYSITKFGDDRTPQPLSSLKLFNAYGNEGSLTATYLNSLSQDGSSIIQQEDHIAYEFLDDLKKIPSGFDMTRGVVTWKGKIQAHNAGMHQFRMTYSGYLKVWMDGELILDRWRESWNPGPALFDRKLLPNVKHDFKIEWIPESTQSFISLKVLDPDPEYTYDTHSFRSEAGKMIDYYFVAGNNLDQVISGYRQLTGKAQIMPKWAFGFWQSRERYKTQEELIETVKTFREREIPLDNIVQDWSYWPEDAWGSHEFDSTRFPNPEGMIKQVHEQYNAHIMISVWPKFYQGIDQYKAFDEKGWLYEQNIKNHQKDWIGQGYVSTFYDAYNPDARKLFWKQIDKQLFSKGIDAWWLDATEPDIYSNSSIQHRKSLMNPTALGSATEYFNGYPLVNAKGVYEGQRKTNPNKRVFILTRSAFPGIQRYGAATWSGDISSRFDELEQQIPAGLNFSLTGMPYWTTDIGGFFVEDKYDRPDPQGEDLEEWRELNTRWYQYGTFTPLYRAHGQYPFREIFNIAPEHHPAYKSVVFYNKLRYRLMPYIYSLAGKVYHEDYTIMRPLVMDFAGNPEVKELKDQFMFGPSIMVNPVYKYKARNRGIYFPENTGWYDLLTGEYQEGGKRETIEAPYEKIPLFVREGAIIPFGPEIQYTSEKPASEIILYVYAGKNGKFELYEDSGKDYDYEKGKYIRIPIQYTEATGMLKLGAQEGKGFEGSLQKRTFHIKYVQKGAPKVLSFDIPSDHTLVYDGSEKNILLR